jgi:hypothetical protein
MHVIIRDGWFEVFTELWMNITELWDDAVFTGNKLIINTASYPRRLILMTASIWQDRGKKLAKNFNRVVRKILGKKAKSREKNVHGPHYQIIPVLFTDLSLIVISCHK